jgi:actin-related protein 5
MAASKAMQKRSKQLLIKEVLLRIKNRQKLKKDLQNRKSHASYMKMKTLSLLTNEAFGAEGPAHQGKRKRKGDRKELAVDEQGIEMLQDIGDSDAEERDESELQHLESQLSKHDPNFDLLIKEKYSIYDVLVKGLQKDRDPTTAELYQLHMNVERIRIPEVLFQPHIMGIDQAGISEILCHSIHKHQLQTVKVFLTGGMAKLEGLESRLFRELRKECLVDTNLKIERAADPVLDAWRGAAQFAQSEVGQDASWILRSEYEEFGAEFFKESRLTNPSN